MWKPPRYDMRRPIARLLLVATCLAIAGDARAADRGQPWVRHIIDNSLSGADGVRLMDVNGDGLLDVTSGWEQGNAVRAYLHPGYAAVGDPWPAVTVGAVSNAEDSVFADLDDDGAVDVISSAEGNTQGVFVSWAPTLPADYLNPNKWQTAKIPDSAGRKWMFALPMQVDGKNGIDLVVGGKNTDAKVAWFESPAGDRRNLANWKIHAMSNAGWIMSVIAYDVNNDGDDDVVVTDRNSDANLQGARWLENPGTGTAAQKNAWTNHFIGAKTNEPMLSAFADVDGDGLDDLVVPTVTAGGVSFFRRLDRVNNNWQEFHISQPANTGSPKGANVGDIDLDGDPDIVLSYSHADGDLSGVVWLSYVNKPFGDTWVDHEISGPLGIKYDLVALLDLDHDGDLDMMSTEENEAPNSRGLGVIWYENPTRSPQAIPGDFDHDGDVDQQDFGVFQGCLTGAGYPQNAPECADAKLDLDDDVDESDFILFEKCITASNIPANPNCLQ